jgi:hypothetical protein
VPHRAVVAVDARIADRPPILRDTWEYDGEQWVRLDVAAPSPRMSAGATYDARRGMAVTFGGRSGYPNGDLADTWEWDGASLTRFGD